MQLPSLQADSIAVIVNKRKHAGNKRRIDIPRFLLWPIKKFSTLTALELNVWFKLVTLLLMWLLLILLAVRVELLLLEW